MTGNRFGTLFQYTSFGESHGPALGCVVDGVPPRIPLSQADIQPFLDARRPGQSRHTTQRKEPDAVKIVSGVFEGQTLGTPIGLMIENVDARSKDYGDIKDKFRPGHADFTYDAKYGHRDYRGGGRSSARETAMRVAAGAVARKILEHELGSPPLTPPPAGGKRGRAEPGGSKGPCFRRDDGKSNNVAIRGAVVQIGPYRFVEEGRKEPQCPAQEGECPPSPHTHYGKWDWEEVGNNPFFAPNAEIAEIWAEYLDDCRKRGSSAGAVIEVVASGIPAGLGAPVYDKLDADLAKAMMSINAVKAVEIGTGFDVVELGGEDNADEIRVDDNGKPVFLSNNAGGILGGISSGQDIVVRVAFKPTSSILTPKQTIDKDGHETEIVTKGRHDPCVGLRGMPVCEAMMACVLADHYLRHKAQCL